MKKPSKFRLVKGTPKKKEGQFIDYNNCYRNSDSNVIAVSASTIAVVYGGGKEVAFVSVSKDPSIREPPKHLLRTDSLITDIVFSDLDDELLATGQENGTTKLWRIPRDGGTEDIVNAETELRGVHKKKVTSVCFNPVAPDVIATASMDGSIAVWVSGEAKIVLNVPSNIQVYSVNFSPNGDRLLATASDKKTRVWNVRSKELLVEFASIHDGVKPANGIFLGQGTIASVGFSKSRERQVQIYNVDDQKQICKTSIDSGTGVMRLAFDVCSGLLFVSGKGDSLIRVFEFLNYEKLNAIDPCGLAGLSFLSTCMFPKREVDVNKCEIARLYGVSGATAQTSIVPISFVAPRKVVKFDPELYLVEAKSGEASCTAEEWIGGADVTVSTCSLDPQLRAGKALSTKEQAKQKAEESKSFRKWDGPEPEAVVVPKAIDVESEEVKKFDKVEYKNVKVVRSSHFRHLFGKPFANKDHMNGLNCSRSSESSTLICATNDLFAVPYDGPGGRVAVIPTNYAGRLPKNFSMVETGSVVQDICFGAFSAKNVLITAQDNATILGFKIPEEGLDLSNDASNVNNTVFKFAGHKRKVTNVLANATVDNVLASVSSYAEELKIWDLQKETSLYSLGNLDQVFSIDWSYSGDLLSSISKDGKIRIIDPRQQKIVNEFASHDLPEKTSSVVWGKDHMLLSTGFAKGSQRQVKLYDSRKGVLGTQNLEISNSVYKMNFDVGTNVLYLAGKGDSSISMLEITPEDSKCIHPLTDYRSKDPQMGVAFLPKQSVNVKDVEVMRVLKLCADKVEPIQILCPRQRKEFFQDDLYPNTRSISSPALSAADWASGKTAVAKEESLKPQDMTLLSQAPEVEKSKKPSSAYFLEKAREESEKADDLEKIKDTLFNKVQSRFGNGELEANDNDDVDSDEW